MAKWFVLAGAGITLITVSGALARSRRPVRGALASALLGAGALAAVNLLAPYTGVSLPANYVTGFTAAVLSLPGVAALLALRLLLFA